MRDALRRLAAARDVAWRNARQLRQQRATESLDPRRRSGGVRQSLLADMRRQLEAAQKAGDALRHAYRGLSDPLWVERYLGERILPLESELESLANCTGGSGGTARRTSVARDARRAEAAATTAAS